MKHGKKIAIIAAVAVGTSAIAVALYKYYTKIDKDINNMISNAETIREIAYKKYPGKIYEINDTIRRIQNIYDDMCVEFHPEGFPTLIKYQLQYNRIKTLYKNTTSRCADIVADIETEIETEVDETSVEEINEEFPEEIIEGGDTNESEISE